MLEGRVERDLREKREVVIRHSYLTILVKAGYSLLRERDDYEYEDG